MFSGCCPVVNVPFHEDYSIDFEGLRSIVDFVHKSGCKSICLFAFNSEPYKLSFDEKKETIKSFLEFNDKRMKTLVGIVENSIPDCVELGRTAKRFGADGIILYPPALSTPAGKSLMEYFRIIAEEVDLPVMIQDNPRSTGVTMSMDLLLGAYREIQQFDYIKVECPIPMRKMRDLIKATDGKLKCYSGNGGIFAIDAFLSGAEGIMPGVLLAGEFHQMTELFHQNKIEEARDMFEKILPLAWYEDQSLEFYISCEKFLLKELGIIKCGAVRKPCTSLTDVEKEELLNLYGRLKKTGI